MPEQLLNILKIIFEKLKNGFLVSKMGKINFLEDYNIPKNLSFGGHIWDFQVKNTRKSWHLKAVNDVQSTSEQLQNNFHKVHKTTFLALKILKMAL